MSTILRIIVFCLWVGVILAGGVQLLNAIRANDPGIWFVTAILVPSSLFAGAVMFWTFWNWDILLGE